MREVNLYDGQLGRSYFVELYVIHEMRNRYLDRHIAKVFTPHNEVRPDVPDLHLDSHRGKLPQPRERNYLRRRVRKSKRVTGCHANAQLGKPELPTLKYPLLCSQVKHGF